jgi:hypothetical protein
MHIHRVNSETSLLRLIETKVLPIEGNLLNQFPPPPPPGTANQEPVPLHLMQLLCSMVNVLEKKQVTGIELQFLSSPPYNHHYTT